MNTQTQELIPTKIFILILHFLNLKIFLEYTENQNTSMKKNHQLLPLMVIILINLLRKMKENLFLFTFLDQNVDGVKKSYHFGHNLLKNQKKETHLGLLQELMVFLICKLLKDTRLAHGQVWFSEYYNYIVF